jgi:GGDEF domain-containing protein
MTNKKLTRVQLEERIEKLSQCPIWECYTRAAIELRWNELTQNARAVVYCDIDSMHRLNEKYNHSGVDKRIKTVLKKIRKTDSVIISRWLNGDELIFILNSGIPQEFINRLIELFHKVGIECTYSYTTNVKRNPYKTVNPLDSRVQNSKNKGNRGVIVE